jgi:hypothetical protein
VKTTTEVTLGNRLTTYAVLLKQLDVVVAELETVGFVTIADRDKWERLITPERLRVGVAMRSLGVSVFSQVPSLEAAKAAPGGNGVTAPPVKTSPPLPPPKAKAARA